MNHSLNVEIMHILCTCSRQPGGTTVLSSVESVSVWTGPRKKPGKRSVPRLQFVHRSYGGNVAFKGFCVCLLFGVFSFRHCRCNGPSDNIYTVVKQAT